MLVQFCNIWIAILDQESTNETLISKQPVNILKKREAKIQVFVKKQEAKQPVNMHSALGLSHLEGLDETETVDATVDYMEHKHRHAFDLMKKNLPESDSEEAGRRFEVAMTSSSWLL